MGERRESVSARAAVLRETFVLPSVSESVRKGTVGRDPRFGRPVDWL
jgi:hypothetical protein